MKKSIRLVAIAAMALVLAVTAGAQVKHLTMGTAGVSGTNYPTGIAM